MLQPAVLARPFSHRQQWLEIPFGLEGDTVAPVLTTDDVQGLVIRKPNRTELLI